VDVIEMACGNWYVLPRYLNMALYFGPLEVQASSLPGGDIHGKSFPYVPGGDEVARRPHARMGAPCRWSNTYRQRSLGTSGRNKPVARVTDEVQIPDFLFDDLQNWAGTECLYVGFGVGPCS
jgi:hypothetical protein